MRRYGLDENEEETDQMEYGTKSGKSATKNHTASRDSFSADKMSRDGNREEWVKSGVFDKPRLSLE